MWGYLWIPILFSLSKEFSSVEAQSKILLPSQRQRQQNDAVSSLSVLVPRCPVPDSKLNYRPVIGIVTHPGDGASGRLNNATNASYIAASYVKFVESAGARVIPLIYNEPEDVLFEKLELVNGVLYTGGWAKDGLYYAIVEKVFKYGISPETLQKNLDLSRFFKMLTTSADEDNKVYVSTVQAYDYPVTAFQWHPEKNAFEWGSSAIPHSEDAIEVTQHVANYFISEARWSVNRPPAQKVLDNLIYNYRPTFCGKAG
ncbi:gamma-glutamyl hydrolase 2 [Citrus sinensis]|nr:gamma-glutamyl hydrolase 2 [Citrus sinensis]